MSEVKNTKNQAAQAEDILREPSGAQKESGTGGKKEGECIPGNPGTAVSAVEG